MLIALFIALVHVSHGPSGVVVWIQPPHISAGIAFLRSGIQAWWEVG
jgi:hypothetical protein